LPLRLIFLVGNRAFDDQDKRPHPVLGGIVEKLHEVFADFVGKDGIMKADFRNARNNTEHDVLEARLRRPRHRNRIPIATEAGCDPENVDFFDVHFGNPQKIAVWSAVNVSD